MKFGKLLAVIAMVSATSLFAATLDSIDSLVDKINTTKDQKAKTKLLNQLDDELQAIDKKDFVKAQEIVNKKLKIEKVLTN